LTSTPQPPLEVHEWYPDRVLVYYQGTGGDGGDFLTNLTRQLPLLILYSDGTLIKTISINLPDEDRYEIIMRKLDRQGICQFLNTFDQIGYLDYDPSSYKVVFGKNVPMGMGGTLISVDAWKSTDGYFYGLGYFMQADYSVSTILSNDSPALLPALHDAFTFLSEYSKDNFVIYSPEHLGIWVYRLSDLEKYGFKDNRSPRGLWPLKSPSLASIFNIAGSNAEKNLQQYYVLDKEDANSVYDFFGDSFSDSGEIVVEDNVAYLVFARPLLPYEKPELGASLIPTPGATKANTKLICYPSDGVLPIPASTYK
jgi:hypothetical protein